MWTFTTISNRDPLSQYLPKMKEGNRVDINGLNHLYMGENTIFIIFFDGVFLQKTVDTVVNVSYDNHLNSFLTP